MIRSLSHSLKNAISTLDYTNLETFICNKCENIKHKLKFSQRNKFDSMLPNKNQKHCSVLNLSTKSISPHAISVLERGLNFVPSKPINIPKTVAAIESSISQLPEEDKTDTRNRIVPILKRLERNNNNTNNKNLSKKEEIALRQIKNDKDIVITSSDKGKNTVLLDYTDYDHKMKSHLSDTTIYLSIQDDPLNSFKKEQNKILHRIKRSFNLEPSLIKGLLASKEHQLPIIYGLPKIHKENIPIRNSCLH